MPPFTVDEFTQIVETSFSASVGGLGELRDMNGVGGRVNEVGVGGRHKKLRKKFSFARLRALITPQGPRVQPYQSRSQSDLPLESIQCRSSSSLDETLAHPYRISSYMPSSQLPSPPNTPIPYSKPLLLSKPYKESQEQEKEDWTLHLDRYSPFPSALLPSPSPSTSSNISSSKDINAPCSWWDEDDMEEEEFDMNVPALCISSDVEVDSSPSPSERVYVRELRKGVIAAVWSEEEGGTDEDEGEEEVYYTPRSSFGLEL